MNKYLLSLGSNTDKIVNMAKCRDLLNRLYSDISFSEMIETEPFGNDFTVDFYNQLALVNTDDSAEMLNAQLKNIEKEIGRCSGDKSKGIVKIDLDLLAVNDDIVKIDDFKRPYLSQLLNNFGLTSLNMNIIETERLILRKWKKEDLPLFIEMNNNPQVMQYFPKRLSKDETIDFYNRIQNEFLESGYGPYAVEVKENNQFIGFIGFHKATFLSDFTPCIEIGWRLTDSAWGEGYASEGAAACLKYGFNKLGFDEVYSFTAVINKKSERVMQKIGMKKVDEFNHPNVNEDSPLYKHILYRLRRILN